ncbi:hypothetical protein SGPA1_11441 [Streptomyces misionensis JCM 4497]
MRVHGWREHDAYGPAQRRHRDGTGRRQPARAAAVGGGRGPGPGAVPRRLRLGGRRLPAVHRAHQLHDPHHRRRRPRARRARGRRRGAPR